MTLGHYLNISNSVGTSNTIWTISKKDEDSIIDRMRYQEAVKQFKF